MFFIKCESVIKPLKVQQRKNIKFSIANTICVWNEVFKKILKFQKLIGLALTQFLRENSSE